VGAAFVIDATQTVGAMPFDVLRVKPDALVVHSYKSMLSNYGLGFAVFSDRFLDASPLEESWLMRSGSDNFARLVDYEDRYAQGMRRFDTSLRANPTLIAMLEVACRMLINWQPGRVREYLLKIERLSVDRMRSLGFEVADEDERCANLFGVKLAAGMDPEACRRHLARRQIHVAVRGSAVRVSPHVYNHLGLEVRDFGELTPFYGQAVKLFSAIFLFISLVMGIIVLFAVVNTMTMNVMERTSEIGTSRALGVLRRDIRRQFVAEGWLIGAVGASAGSALAFLVAAAVNHAGLTWLPPGNANPVPLRLAIDGNFGLVVGAWVGLVIIATVAALVPANTAARLTIVDALRHV
jgi:uncharacterized membrane protein